MPSLSPLDTVSRTSPPPPAQATPSPDKLTLLIVDDEEGPRQSLKIVFKDRYNILLATGGQGAIELAKTHEINVAVLDILMAGMSGVELLKRLKEINPSTEVIMLTAYETMETARQAIRYGASDYLNKPFDIPTMRAAVSRAAEKHRTARELQSTNAMVEDLQTEISNRQHEEEMARARGDIYASVLHDINSPLTVISGFAEMINRSIENAASLEGEQLNSIRGDLNKLNDQVSRCFEISRRYLSFLNTRSKGASRVSANQVLADLKDLLQRHPKASGHQLTVHDLPHETVAEINGTDLLQILLNLTINALQSAPHPHRVEIRCQRLEHTIDVASFRNSARERFINSEGFLNRAPLLAIAIQDNGDGIPAEEMPKLFDEKFTTKAPGEGTGLGLSIVKRLVREANGAIHVQTERGRGSTFTVCLQLHE